MASTPNHSLQGALLHAGMALLLGASSTVVAVAVTLGAVFGALPDFVGWTGRQAGLMEGWALYGSAHHGPIARLLNWIPAYRLHTLLDIPFHEPDGNWWPRYWHWEALLWVVNASVIYLMVR